MKVAVLGSGYWGRNLVRNFAELGVLAMVCDPSEEARENAGKMAPRIDLASDPAQAWVSKVDGIVIATPASTHFELARQSLMAGKHVFCEKPLALDYDQGAELVKMARDRRLILMVGHVLEYHPAVAELMNVVESGRLGKIQYIYSNRLSFGKVRREENILWSFAPHDIAITLRIANSMPFEVVACGGNYVQPNVADVTITNLLFDNGVRAHIFVSWLHPFKEQRLVVIGTQRMASFDDQSKKLLLYDRRVEVKDGVPMPVDGRGEEIPFAADEPLRIECKAFLSAMESGKPPLTDGASGLRVLRVLQAAQRSLITHGEPVRLPIEATA